MTNDFKLAPIFSDKMILQRDKPSLFFGEARVGAKVKLFLPNLALETIANEAGQFQIEVPPFSANETVSCEFISEGVHITLKKILFGDVYLVAGQSNMEFQLKNDVEVAQEKMDWSKIRFYNVTQMEYPGHMLSMMNWEKANENMSAVAYYFAVKLFIENPAIPIGIIGCYKGGTSASCWVSEEVLAENKVLKQTYLEPFERAVLNKNEAELEAEREAFEAKSQSFARKKEAFIAEHPEMTLMEVKQILGHSPWPPPMTPKSYGRPSGLFHTMLQTIIGMKFRAIIWYQGEEDVQFGSVYQLLLEKLIKQWRQIFGQDELPFFIVQLPRYANAPDGSWPIIREIQEQVAKETLGAYLITTIDTGEAYDIHPPSKRVIGERTAFTVNKILNQAVESVTPRMGRLIRSTIVIENAKQLTVIGEYPFNFPGVEIKGATLIISTASEPVFQYAYENFPRGYLVNEYGIPVSPFQVDLPS
ncbi:sialate O-acetylesterase [Listeria seeligeri]|uniref:sialate O-acetylesterase n=1 Tax=Listeria seeligeri TaxID=1640 RepID=UPI0022EBBA58|nr:sialate O-acetylesterase [Listeria seeligeri]